MNELQDMILKLVSTNSGWIARQVLKWSAAGAAIVAAWLHGKGYADNVTAIVAGFTASAILGTVELVLSFVSRKYKVADDVKMNIDALRKEQPPTTRLPVIAGLLCCLMLPSCGLTSSEWLAIGRDVALREAPIVYGQVQTVKANRTAAKQPHAVIP